MTRSRIHVSRQASILLLAGAVHAAATIPDSNDHAHHVAPTVRLPDEDEHEFSQYTGDLVNLSRKVLMQVKSINDEYMVKLHKAMCAKQQAFFTAGVEHQVPVCQRVPPGFDKDLDCPKFHNALGHEERKVLSSHCSDLLEEEYFYNLTMGFEKNLKELQKDRLEKLEQESDAVRAEFTMHLSQVQEAGARSLLEAKPAEKPAAKAKQAEHMAEWSAREREAWRAEVHMQAEDYAASMTKIVKDLQRMRKNTLEKVASDLNRTIGRARTVNRKELEQHKEPWDCWAKLDMDVFDFTPWILSHPGGGRLISEKCGTDVTNTWNHFHAAVGSLPGERRIGLWDANDEIGTTTQAPCEHEFAKEEQAAVKKEDGHVEETESGKEEEVHVSLAEKRRNAAGVKRGNARKANLAQVSTEESPSSPVALPVDPRFADETASSPVSLEAFQARSAAAAESASSPVPLMRRAE